MGRNMFVMIDVRDFLSELLVATIYYEQLKAGIGPKPRRLGLETVSKPIHGLVSVSSRLGATSKCPGLV